MSDDVRVGVAARTLVLRSGMGPEDMVWPAIDRQESWPYILDLSRWLPRTGSTIAHVAVESSSDPNMTVGQPSLDPTGTQISVLLTGGTPATQPIVGLVVVLANGSRAFFAITLLDVTDFGAGLLPVLPAPPPASTGQTLTGIAYYSFTQAMPSTLWIIDHELGRYPNVALFDSAGEPFEGDVDYPTINQVTVTLSAAVAGTATCS